MKEYRRLSKEEIEYEYMLFTNDLEEYKCSEQGKIVRLLLNNDNVDGKALHKAVDDYYTARNGNGMVWLTGAREEGIKYDNEIREMIRRSRAY